MNCVLVVGTPAPDLRVRQAARGLFILPAEAAPIEGTAMNVIRGPVCGFGSWATRAVEQASEPFLIPGVIGSDLADMIACLLEGCDIDPAAEVACASLVQAVATGGIGKRDLVVLNITGGGHRKLRRDRRIAFLRPHATFTLKSLRQEGTARGLALLRAALT